METYILSMMTNGWETSSETTSVLELYYAAEEITEATTQYELCMLKGKVEECKCNCSNPSHISALQFLSDGLSEVYQECINECHSKKDSSFAKNNDVHSKPNRPILCDFKNRLMIISESLLDDLALSPLC